MASAGPLTRNPEVAPLRVGSWLVEPERQRIIDGDTVHHLEPRIMRVLLGLAEQPGTVVSRDVILDDVWGDVVVNEDALTRAVSDLRRLLGDDPAAPAYIETIRGVGYRLVAPVTVEDPGALAEAAGTPRAAPPVRRLPSGPWITAGMLAGLLVGLTGWVLTRSDEPAVRLPILTLDPFTSDPGYEREPALSPDGSRVAFSGGDDAWSEEFDLYVKQPTAETPLRLTDMAGLEAWPVWSPDGTTVAFAHLGPDRSSALYTVPGIGGPVRKLIDTHSWVFGLDWSPAGGRIVYAERGGGDTPGFHLALLDLETLAATVLTNPPRSERDHTPAFSPDGRRVAFVRSTPVGAGDVYVVPVEGGAPRRITTLKARIQGLDWSDDGQALFVLSHYPGTTRLWRVAVDDGSRTAVPTTGRNMVHLTAAGGRLVIEEASAEADVWRLDLHASPPGGAEPFLSSTRWDGQPVFAPDGRSVAFISTRSGNAELWLADRNGAFPIRLTSFDGPLVARPRWSPDSRRLAFDVTENGAASLYVVHVEGGALHRLTDDGQDALAASWSRDGRWIYVASDRGGQWDIWKVPASGGGAVRVTTEGGFSAREGPGGQALYYTKVTADGLWRRPLTGGPEERILERPMRWGWDAWGLSGDGIYYLDMADSSLVVSHYAWQDGAVRVLASLPPRRFHPSVSLSPDGSVMLFAEERTTGSDLYLGAFH